MSSVAVPRPRLPSDDPLYRTPALAWPSVALFLLALLAWSLGFALAASGRLPAPLAILHQAFWAYALFTVLHEGAHRSLARGRPWLNDALANLAGAVLSPVGSVEAFRQVHFAHHRETNHPLRDPDCWSGQGATALLPLKWAALDLHYLAVILRDRQRLPRRRLLTMAGFTATLLLAYGASWPLGLGPEATLYWLLPSRLAIFWLSLVFNYLPHHPHEVLQADNPYAATRVWDGGGPLARWLLFYQNYHLIHHLFPSVPFYRYLAIWRRRREECLAGRRMAGVA